MITTLDPYAPGPMPPALRIGHNIGILTQGSYRFFRVIFAEGLPPSPQFTQDLGAIGANSTGNQTEITVINAQEGNLISVRMRPLDTFEAQVSQVLAAGRFTSFAQHGRVTQFLAGVDPWFATTTVFVLGNTRALNITPHNVSDYAIGQSRMSFWGWRYVIDRLREEQETVLGKVILNEPMDEDERNLAKTLRGVTLVPAEGREV